MTGAAPASARGAWDRAAARLDPILLPRIAFWALAMWAISFTVADPNLWGHVRFGQDILAAGTAAGVMAMISLADLQRRITRAI